MAEMYNFHHNLEVTGALDLSNPEDYLSYYKIGIFIIRCNEQFGSEPDFNDKYIQEIINYPSLYHIHRRTEEYGIVNFDRPNKSLVDEPTKEKIVFDLKTEKFVNVNNLGVTQTCLKWLKSYWNEKLAAIAKYLEDTPAMILIKNLNFYLGIVTMCMSADNFFTSVGVSRKLGKLGEMCDEEEKLVEANIRDIKAIYNANRPKQEALFGPCQFGRTCKMYPAELEHQQAVEILSSMCIFSCPPCYKMSHDPEIVKKYKFKFDAKSQIKNAHLLRDYYFKNEEMIKLTQETGIEVIGTNNTQEASPSSATPALKTTPAVKVEAAASSAAPALKTQPITRVEATPSSATTNLKTAPQAKVETTERQFGAIKTIEDMCGRFNTATASRVDQQKHLLEAMKKQRLERLQQSEIKQEVHCNLHEEFFPQVEEGIKTVEIRRYQDKWQSIQPGHVITFNCGNKRIAKAVESQEVIFGRRQIVEKFYQRALPGRTLDEAIRSIKGEGLKR